MHMRLDAFRTPHKSFFPGVIISDDIVIREPMEFVIDTGAVKTTISAFYFDDNFNYSQLERGDEVLGVGGYQKTYIIHNVRVYLYTNLQKWFLIRKFDQMTVLSRRYNSETGELIEIPCLLGTDIIGNDFILNYNKNDTFLE